MTHTEQEYRLRITPHPVGSPIPVLVMEDTEGRHVEVILN